MNDARACSNRGGVCSLSGAHAGIILLYGIPYVLDECVYEELKDRKFLPMRTEEDLESTSPEPRRDADVVHAAVPRPCTIGEGNALVPNTHRLHPPHRKSPAKLNTVVP